MNYLERVLLVLSMYSLAYCMERPNSTFFSPMPSGIESFTVYSIESPTFFVLKSEQEKSKQEETQEFTLKELENILFSNQSYSVSESQSKSKRKSLEANQKYQCAWFNCTEVILHKGRCEHLQL